MVITLSSKFVLGEKANGELAPATTYLSKRATTGSNSYILYFYTIWIYLSSKGISEW